MPENLICDLQPLNDELGNQLIGIMLYLNSEDSTKDLYLYINSQGGEISSGIALYDTMNYVKPPVNTVCVGTAASIAAFVLTGGMLLYPPPPPSLTPPPPPPPRPGFGEDLLGTHCAFSLCSM